MGNNRETIIVGLEDYEVEAKRLLTKSTLDYYRSGAGNELTLDLNKSCFDKLRIRPRFLRDVRNRDLSCEIFGDRLTIPIGICPTAMQKLAHPDGELANVRAAEAAGIIFTLSTLSTSSIEQVARAAPKCVKWLQLYIFKDRNITVDLIRRAEAANFKAIVLTVDAPYLGLRRADVRNQFKLPSSLKFANFEDEEHSSGDVDGKNEGVSGLNKYAGEQFDQSLVWDDLKWLAQLTKLPILVKGILTAEDAELAVKYGCKGVIVSNHGARQLDSVPASIEALPEIVQAVRSKTAIVFDGGVRQGTDVFKALALGADLVFIGRPALWGLAVDGQKGVANVISILRKEFDLTMALTGCQTLSDIERCMVVHENYFSKL